MPNNNVGQPLDARKQTPRISKFSRFWISGRPDSDAELYFELLGYTFEVTSSRSGGESKTTKKTLESREVVQSTRFPEGDLIRADTSEERIVQMRMDDSQASQIQ
jgi:hypothetical protein